MIDLISAIVHWCASCASNSNTIPGAVGVVGGATSTLGGTLGGHGGGGDAGANGAGDGGAGADAGSGAGGAGAGDAGEAPAWHGANVLPPPPPPPLYNEDGTPFGTGVSEHDPRVQPPDARFDDDSPSDPPHVPVDLLPPPPPPLYNDDGTPFGTGVSEHDPRVQKPETPQEDPSDFPPAPARPTPIGDTPPAHGPTRIPYPTDDSGATPPATTTSPGDTLNPDGTTTHTNPDGSTTTTIPDPPGDAVNPDGTTTHTNPDGSTTTTIPPKSLSPDTSGFSSSRNPDGK